MNYKLWNIKNEKLAFWRISNLIFFKIDTKQDKIKRERERERATHTHTYIYISVYESIDSESVVLGDC